MKNPIYNVWQSIRYWVYMVVSYLTGKIPVRVSYGVASLVGDFIYLTWKRHAANAVSNMRHVLGEQASLEEVKLKARDSFRNYAKTLVDFLRFPHLSFEDIDQAITRQQGWEYLDEGIARGKGTIVVSGHIGNWDLAGALLGHHGLPLHAVADTFEPERMDNLINGTRERHGINIIKMDAGSLKQIFTALKKNEIVLLLFDRPEDEKSGVPVKFFGETAYLPSGPAAIAIKTKATLSSGFCLRRRGDKTFSGTFEEPIEYLSLLTGDKERDIQIVTQEIVNRLEQTIRDHPEQWYMFRAMWPRTRQGDAEIRRRSIWGKRSLRRALSLLRPSRRADTAA